MLHHRPADSPALEFRLDNDILDDAGRRTALAEVVHDEQGEGTGQPAIVLGQVQLVVRVDTDALEQRLGFLNG